MPTPPSPDDSLIDRFWQIEKTRERLESVRSSVLHHFLTEYETWLRSRFSASDARDIWGESADYEDVIHKIGRSVRRATFARPPAADASSQPPAADSVGASAVLEAGAPEAADPVGALTALQRTVYEAVPLPPLTANLAALARALGEDTPANRERARQLLIPLAAQDLVQKVERGLYARVPRA